MKSSTSKLRTDQLIWFRRPSDQEWYLQLNDDNDNDDDGTQDFRSHCKPTIDKLVPSQDLGHLSYSSFTDFNPDKDIF